VFANAAVTGIKPERDNVVYGTLQVMKHSCASRSSSPRMPSPAKRLST
jgi:hypothetical protein